MGCLNTVLEADQNKTEYTNLLTGEPLKKDCLADTDLWKSDDC